MGNKVLTVVQETVILGKKIRLYGSIKTPLFLAKDVAEWIDYSVSNVSKMLKSVDDDEKTTRKFCMSGSNYQTEAWFLTEDGLYECCAQSRKPIAKEIKKEIKLYLKSIHSSEVANTFVEDAPECSCNAELQETSEIHKFVNDNFGTIRTVTLNGEPWFIAKDVCDVLGTTNPTMAMEGLEKYERAKFNLGRQGEANIISESGFYTLVLRSRKAIAKPFRLWVTCEVLPQIRKTGGYIPVHEHDTEKEILARAFLIANNTLTELKAMYDTLMNTDGLMQINTVAKELGIGEYHLFSFLRDKKVFFYNKDNVNIPYERFRKNGCFAVKETLCHDGKYRSVTYATKKGLDYVRKLLLKDGYYDSLLS